MQNKELLENFRAQIDTLDKELLYLFSRRFTIVNEIGKIKKQDNIAALQPDRWKKLLTENILVGEDLGVNKDFIEDIWTRIHNESLRIEK